MHALHKSRDMINREKKKLFAGIITGILSIVIGLYPLIYIIFGTRFFSDNNIGLLASKSAELLGSTLWTLGFYGHIIFGGIALMTGWLQFLEKFRNRYMVWHRKVGKIYVFAAVISALCGIGIGFYATGGIISAAGFISLGIFWLLFTLMAYKAIKNGNVQQHQAFMIYSFSACFAAVTLRIWLPLLTAVIGEFIQAYQIVAWLCWVPNLVVAHMIVRRKKLMHPSQHL